MIYEGTSLRPSAFEIKYKIDGKKIEFSKKLHDMGVNYFDDIQAQVRLKGMRFGDIKDKTDIIQQSRLGTGKKWTHLIEDTRESVKKIMNKKINCD